MNIGKFLKSSNSYKSDDSKYSIYSELKINSCLGGILPIFIIYFLSYSSYDTYIAAFPDYILSVYFSSAFVFLINFDFTSIESTIFAVNEVKIYFQ